MGFASLYPSCAAPRGCAETSICLLLNIYICPLLNIYRRV